MTRAHAYSGPKLPKGLLEQVQIGTIRRSSHEQPRKQRRQAQRSQRKQQKSNTKSAGTRAHDSSYEFHGTSVSTPAIETTTPVKENKSHARSISKRRAQVEVRKGLGSRDNAIESAKDRDSEAFTSDFDSDGDAEQIAPTVSEHTRRRLEEDDAEIARLEKKLGVKNASTSARGDELTWLVNGSDSDVEERSGSKRERAGDDDEWLRKKRRKLQNRLSPKPRGEALGEDLDKDSNAELLNRLESSALKSTGQADNYEAFEGFSEDDAVNTAIEKRENPYVPPTSEAVTRPACFHSSPRKASAADEEMPKNLQRQVQGLLNRLSEANIMSILHSIEQIYANSVRQHVTSTLISLLISRIADESTLSETFLVLHAAFATAVYRVVGTDFIAQLVESIVKIYDEAQSRRDNAAKGKETLNMLTFLSNLYILRAVGCEIIFDFIRLLLDTFTEANTEILLRIIRTCGVQLRQDDPSSLKDIVLLLQRSVAKAGGEAHVSVRTKFMVETIMDLKNNRMKSGAGASMLAAEQVKRMKKSLGSLATSNRTVRTTEPLRIGLQDLRDIDKKGKWWLVGASFKEPSRAANDEVAPSQQSQKTLSGPTPIEDRRGSGKEVKNVIDLPSLARVHGMNTDVRRAVFFALLDSVSYQHAQERILKLNLKNKQTLEIPRVIMRCAAVEQMYNHFYTLVAQQFCGEHRLRKAWEFGLLDIWRRMGEEDEGDDHSDDSGALGVREVYNLAKLYASLIAEGLLRITILRTLSFAPESGLQAKTKVFLRVVIGTVLLLLHKKSKRERQPLRNEVGIVFQHAHVVADFAHHLQHFLAQHFSSDDVAELVRNQRERTHVVRGLGCVMEVLEKPAVINGPRSEESAAEEDNNHGSDNDL